MNQIVKEKQNIPEGWFETTLDNECAFLKGQGLSKSLVSDNGKFPCLLYGQLFTTYNEIIIEVKSRTDSEDGVISEMGDVLIPASTTTVAKDLAIASALQQGGVRLGGDINIVRKKSDSYDSNFLAYYLTHYKNKDLSSYAQGITIIHLSSSKFKDLEICIPKSKVEQQKIAGILEAVDADIEETKSVIKATEKLKKGLMQELFTRGIGHTKFKQSELGEIPESWSICPLNSIATVIDSLHKTPKFAEEGYAMVRVSDIKTGNLNISTALRVPEEVYKEFTSNYIPKKGDLVLSRVGSYGVVSYVATEEKFCMGQNTVVINCDLDAKYVYFALNSDLVKNQIENQVAGSGYKSLSLKSIRELKVPVPVSGEVIRISEILFALDEKIQVNKKLLAKQTELKKGLMQDLLSGVKRVNI